MGLFAPQIEIAENEGFTHENDLFGRQAFGETLTKIIRAIDGPGVILLDAPWGSGKTTFVKAWRGELAKAEIHSIYFDAFANDYQEDAFLALASEIVAEAKELAPKRSKALTAFKTKAAQTAKVLGRASIGVALRALTAGMVEAEHLGKVAEQVMEAASEEAKDALDKAFEKRLESHDSDQNVFANFRQALTRLAESLSLQSDGSDSDSPEQNNPPSAPPLIFIIDELDRCRPTFTLQLLEKIKHFFSVPGVLFVLVSSVPQLEAVIRYAYGQIDAATYLEKFYQLRILFPAGTPERPDSAVETFLRHRGCNRDFVHVLGQFSRVQNLSLRTLDHIATYERLLRISLRQGLFVPSIAAILCAAKVTNHGLYDKLRRGDAYYPAVAEFARFEEWKNPSAPNQPSRVAQISADWWNLALGEQIDEGRAQELANSLLGFHIGPTQLIQFFCRFIDGFMLPNV